MDKGNIHWLLVAALVVFCDQNSACYEEDGKLWECKYRNDCVDSNFKTNGNCGELQVCCPPPWHYTSISTPNRYCENHQELCPTEDESIWPDEEKDVFIPPKIYHHPYMALIGFEYNQKVSWECGGTLISSRFVLTAGQCTTETPKGQPRWVRLGASKGYSQDTSKDYRIVNVYTHHMYNGPVLYDDLALLQLERDVKFNQNVSPACLHTFPKVSYKYGITTGWERNSLTTSINDGAVQILNDTLCDTIHRDFRFPQGGIPEKMICTKRKTRFCSGDLGAPLMIKVSSSCLKTVAGVVSFRGNCSDLDSPTIFTRVSYYLPWISSIVWPSSSGTRAK